MVDTTQKLSPLQRMRQRAYNLSVENSATEVAPPVVEDPVTTPAPVAVKPLTKKEYLLQAMRSETCLRVDWVVDLFTFTSSNKGVSFEGFTAEAPDFPYRIIAKGPRFYYQDPDDVKVLHPISDGFTDTPLFRIKERINLAPGDLPNIKEPVDTIVGNVIVNRLVFVHPFGDRIPFMTGEITGKRMMKAVVPLVVDDPEEGEQLPAGKVSATELALHLQTISQLSAFYGIAIPAASEKTLTHDPRVKELKQKLLETYKDQLTDPAIIAKIDKELVAFDRQWFVGDSSEGFMNGKAYNIVRKKTHLFHGLEESPIPGEPITVVKNSLAEGWDIQKLPAMANSLRMGSYFRGIDTALGGELVKFFYRIFQNSKISMKDCGVKYGVILLPKEATKEKLERYVGNYLIQGKDLIEITLENYSQFVGKALMIRSPMYCQAGHSDYCELCVGRPMAERPNAIGLEVSEVGSLIMYISMLAMHGKALTLTKYDITRAIT